MPAGDFSVWYAKEGGNLLSQLLAGTYQPQAVKLVEIPKPGGGLRQLRYPCCNRQDNPASYSPSIKPYL